MLRKIYFSIVATLAFISASFATTIPYYSGPQDVPSLLAYLNGLVNILNNSGIGTGAGLPHYPLVPLYCTNAQLSSDATTCANAASLSVSSSGGGVIDVPAGTIISGQITLYSGVYFSGAGKNATVWQLKNNANSAIFQTYQFTSLTGTNTCAAPNNFGVWNMTLDGNYANNATAGYGIQAYGYAATFLHVFARNATINNIYSEFTNSVCGASYTRVEDELIDVGTNNAQGDNVVWAGPHDSQWTNGVNSQAQGVSGGKGANLWVKPAGNGLQINNVHNWQGNYGAYLEASIFADNIELEGANTSNLMVGANGSKISNLITYTGGLLTGNYVATGGCIAIGDATHTTPVTQTTITGLYAYSCNAGGTFAFNHDGGNSKIQGVAFQSAAGVATISTGTKAATTDFDVNVANGASGGQAYFSQPIVSYGTFTETNAWMYQTTNGGVPTGSQGLAFGWNSSNGMGEANLVNLFQGPFYLQGWNGSALTTWDKFSSTSATMAGAIIDTGAAPTLTTGTCSGSSWTGGTVVGKFTAPVCAAGTIIISGLPASPNGYVCIAQDQTTPADTLKQTASTTTSCTLTSTTVANDVIAVSAMGY